MIKRSWLLVVLWVLPVASSASQDVMIAVASNFVQAARELAEVFEENTGYKVQFSASSSGKLFAQINHGAPFDLFLSADAERPALLASNGLAVPDSLVTYATGRLTLWSVDNRYQGKDCVAELKAGNFNRLAIANPRTAPYGLAAEQALEAMGVDAEAMASRIAIGETISQALQFVASRSASLGVIATAQLNLPQVPEGTCRWQVPEDFHMAIKQQAVLLTRSADNPAALAFMEFLTGEQARFLILEHGYGLE